MLKLSIAFFFNLLYLSAPELQFSPFIMISTPLMNFSLCSHVVFLSSSNYLYSLESHWTSLKQLFWILFQVTCSSYFFGVSHWKWLCFFSVVMFLFVFLATLHGYLHIWGSKSLWLPVVPSKLTEEHACDPGYLAFHWLQLTMRAGKKHLEPERKIPSSHSVSPIPTTEKLNIVPDGKREMVIGLRFSITKVGQKTMYLEWENKLITGTKNI